jgi:hypothetical protein
VKPSSAAVSPMNPILVFHGNYTSTCCDCNGFEVHCDFLSLWNFVEAL